MDNGIWAIWYDLDEAARDDHHHWLHETYLPELVRQPGIAWAAHYRHRGGGESMHTIASRMERGPAEEMGGGTQFVTLVGASTPHLFFAKNSPLEAANQSKETRDQLARRSGARQCVFVEEARITGPQFGEADPCGVPGPAIQTGSFRVRTIAEEFDLGQWYAQYRFPFMAQMPGAIRTRKLSCIAGWANHAVLYEFTSLEARMKNFEEPHEMLGLDDKEWTSKIVKYTIHAPGSPTVGERLWPPVG